MKTYLVRASIIWQTVPNERRAWIVSAEGPLMAKNRATKEFRKSHGKNGDIRFYEDPIDLNRVFDAREIYDQMKKKKAKWPIDPYHKREMIHRSKDPEKKFEMRKPTFWESVRYYAGEALIGFIRGLIWPFQKIRGILYEIFWPKTNFRHNGIFGPGGHTSYDQNFSWGRLSFVIVVAFIIVYFIFLR